MEEGHNWETIVRPIYDNLRPPSAILRQGFNIARNGKRSYPYLLVEIDKNKFDYEDPFYGHQSSHSMFETTIALDGDPCFEGVTHPSQLANRTFHPAKDNRLGMFSNSLEISVHQISFGPIDDEHQRVPLQLTYSFTNSDSYAMMTGTLAEHRTLSSSIKTFMKIEPPIAITDKGKDILMAIKKLDARLYAIEQAYPAEDINGTSYPGSIRYAVPYRNITQLSDGKLQRLNEKDSWLNRLYRIMSRK